MENTMWIWSSTALLMIVLKLMTSIVSAALLIRHQPLLHSKVRACLWIGTASLGVSAILNIIQSIVFWAGRAVVVSDSIMGTYSIVDSALSISGPLGLLVGLLYFKANMIAGQTAEKEM